MKVGLASKHCGAQFTWKPLPCCNTLCKWTDCVIRCYSIKFKTFPFIITSTKPMRPCVPFSNERPRKVRASRLAASACPQGRQGDDCDHHYRHKRKSWRLKWGQPPTPTPGFPPRESVGHNLPRLTGAYMPFAVYWNSDHREFTEAPVLQKVLERVVSCSGALGLGEQKRQEECVWYVRETESRWVFEEINRRKECGRTFCSPPIAQVYGGSHRHTGELSYGRDFLGVEPNKDRPVK